jgi:hypothetical protein
MFDAVLSVGRQSPGRSATDFPEEREVTPNPARPLRERARVPSEAELASIPWLALLEPEDQRMARASIMLAHAGPGEQICRIGRPATYWSACSMAC